MVAKSVCYSNKKLYSLSLFYNLKLPRPVASEVSPLAFQSLLRLAKTLAKMAHYSKARILMVLS